MALDFFGCKFIIIFERFDRPFDDIHGFGNFSFTKLLKHLGGLLKPLMTFMDIYFFIYKLL
jgi:hypothetical protein